MKPVSLPAGSAEYGKPSIEVLPAELQHGSNKKSFFLEAKSHPQPPPLCTSPSPLPGIFWLSVRGLSSPSLLQQAPGPGSTGDADSPIPPAGGLSRWVWGWEQHKTAPKWKKTSAVVPRCAPGKGKLDFCPSRAGVTCPGKPCPAHPAALLLGRTWAGELKEPAKPVMALR